MTKHWKLMSFIFTWGMPCRASLLLMGSKCRKVSIKSPPPPPAPFIGPSTCKKNRSGYKPAPLPLPSIYKPVLKWITLFTKFEASRSDQIQKVFWSPLLSSLFWNTFFSLVVSSPAYKPVVYKPPLNPLQSCTSPGLITRSLWYC